MYNYIPLLLLLRPLWTVEQRKQLLLLAPSLTIHLLSRLHRATSNVLLRKYKNIWKDEETFKGDQSLKSKCKCNMTFEGV